AQVHHADERGARAADDVADVLARARRPHDEARSCGLPVFGEVLAVEARTEDAVGAALGGQRPVAHPWRHVRPAAVVTARDDGLRVPYVGPNKFVCDAY